MIIINETTAASVYLTTTLRRSEEDFTMICTRNSDLHTVEFQISKLSTTLRYDRYEVDPASAGLGVGNYQFVIVHTSFDSEYTQTMDIINKFPNAVIQIGKLRVVSNEVNPIIEYQTDKHTILEYEPENI